MERIASAIFGSHGYLGRLVKESIPLVLIGILAYAGIHALLKSADAQATPELPVISSPSSIVLATPEPTPALQPNDCTVIQPDDNAYHVWMELDKPPVVDFWDLAGPGATKQKSTIHIGTKDFLPNPVHPGDKIGLEECNP